MIIDLAKARAESLHKQSGLSRGSFETCVVKTGDHVMVKWSNGDTTLQVLLTIEEAEDFMNELNVTIFRSWALHRQVHGLVTLAWCKPCGEPLNYEKIQGRIIERLEAGVRIVIDPIEDIPTMGLPKDGVYQTTGWHQEHQQGKRDWRILSNLKSPPKTP